ncbi:hypothetical protein RYH80_17995 [Halobaculum sp. MBLA0147]|uniref:hypothetical protein n=1 Tax=Halobaculum sp. MBLA0147 TaxID=3079934 RepID=UPI003524D6AA
MLTELEVTESRWVTSTPFQTEKTPDKHSDYKIPAPIASVLEYIQEHTDVDVVATCCSSCAVSSLGETTGVYFTCQSPNTVPILVGHTDSTAVDALQEACEEHDVPYDWNGTEHKRIAVGTPDYY